MQGLSYPERLTVLKLYSLQHRRERYIIIYVWKILECQVPNFSPPIRSRTSDRRGRACIASHAGVGRLGTLAYNSFRWRAIRMFNQLSLFLRNTTVCSVYSFKKKFGHFYFRTCRRDNGRHDILICRMILLFYYFLEIGHFNNIIK